MGAARLPQPRRPRPEPAGGDRRARLPHRPPDLVLLPARLRGALDHGRGAVRGRRSSPTCGAVATRSRSRPRGRSAASPPSPASPTACSRPARTRAGCRATRSDASREPERDRVGAVRLARTPIRSRHGAAVQAGRRRGALAAHLGGGGPLRGRPRPAAAASSIAHPPPNVTGELHIGHALQSRSGTRSSARADAGLQRALPARLRPRRDLDAERGREAPRDGGQDAARTSAARPSRRGSGSGCASTAARS